MRLHLTWALALLALSAASLSAQVGATTDIVVGRITGPDGAALEGATVDATSIESGITRTQHTNAKGRFTILFPDGGGQYRLSVRYLGLAQAQITVARQADEDRLFADVQLRQGVTTMAQVTVRAQRPRARDNAGEAGRSLSPALVDRLPLDASDLATLATLAPGVVGVASTDSTAAAFSVMGQPTNQNNITLDGLTFGSGSVPPEAIRSTRVITNTFDVARGQFSGGQIASTTRGGTNTVQGAFTYGLRDPALEFSAAENGAFGQQYTQNQAGGGFGGPISHDKAFIFGAFQLSGRNEPLLSLLAADSAASQRLGVRPDSVTRFLGILRQNGIPAVLPGVADARTTDNATAITRLDVNLNSMNTLMVRGDWRGALQDGSRIGPLSVPHSGGDSHTSGGGGMVSLTSRAGTLINELRAYATGETRNVSPYLEIPDGRVTVASTLADTARAVSTLQFGGNPSLPQHATTSLLEASDELSWLSEDASHRVKLGVLFDDSRSRTDFEPNRFGTFTFNSLADLEAGTPSMFTRTLTGNFPRTDALTGAVYLGDAWRRDAALQLTYGVRVEGAHYLDAPAENPEVASLFGFHTSRFPSEVHASPRVGFTYLAGVGDGGPATLTLRGGAGEFRGKAPSTLFSSAQGANGLTNGQSQLVCVGDAVPTPDWAGYLADPTSIPTTCNGAPGTPISALPTVTVFSPSYGAPRTWRATLGASRRFLSTINLSVDAMYARGVSQAGSVDLNLDTQAKFTLASEGGRPVYAPAEAFERTTGAVLLSASRLHPELGIVNEVISTLQSDTKQLVVSMNAFTLGGTQMNASYTLSAVRDQATRPAEGFGFAASTAGDPNQSGWAPSTLERRHNFVLTLTHPVTTTLELTAIGHLLSGAHYTPMVSGDVNGDGLRDDRAFIFNPASAPDSALAIGMSRLLREAPASARDCLASQVGQIASRNSCTAPWQSTLDLQLNYKPTALGLDRRLTLSLQALNTLAGLDQLLHGANNLHGWGQPAAPDQTLLYVRGFDPQSQRFLYAVNEHFGAVGGAQSAFRAPFIVAFTGRFTIGPDPARQQLNNLLRPGGQRQTPEQMRDRLARAMTNPFTQILAIADSAGLALTPEQTERLQTLGDSLESKLAPIVDSLSAVLANPGARPDPAELRTRMRAPAAKARELVQHAVKDAEHVLTPEQWKKVPERIKNPVARGGFGGGGRPGERPDE